MTSCPIWADPLIVASEQCVFSASLIETCKLNDVDPQAYLTDAGGGPEIDQLGEHIDELMPSAWAAERSTNKLAA
jgi:hypothetical protein